MVTGLVKRITRASSLHEYAEQTNLALSCLGGIRATWESAKGGALTEDPIDSLRAVELRMLSASLAAGYRLISQTHGGDVLNVPESVCEAFKLCTERLFTAASLPGGDQQSTATALAYARCIAESGEMLRRWI